MKILLSIVIGTALLAGCSDSSDRKNVMVMPPQEPSVEPPTEPPTLVPSFAAFAREIFADSENNAPRQVNNMEFNQDAADDDFSDLLQ